jgi:hypothetical protein
MTFGLLVEFICFKGYQLITLHLINAFTVCFSIKYVIDKEKNTVFPLNELKLSVTLFALDIQPNSVITNSMGPAIFVRYNLVNLCTNINNLP